MEMQIPTPIQNAQDRLGHYDMDGVSSVDGQVVVGSDSSKKFFKKSASTLENHLLGRAGWLRAAVLGANDGILSTASLLVGVAAAEVSGNNIILTGVAGLVAGAMSMAAGEYVSVSSQSDSEDAELERERMELATDIKAETAELTQIYVKRGLEYRLAKQVAVQLMAFDALGTHARDELGINENYRARPTQAALASAASFAVGAVMPILLALITPTRFLIPTIFIGSLVVLAFLGTLSAKAGGANIVRGAARVTFWGALAMGLTTLVGTLFGVITS